MEHILFFNQGYPLEPLCRALRAGGAACTVTENFAEWEHLSSIRPWSLRVLAVESIDQLPELGAEPREAALLTLAPDTVPGHVQYLFRKVWLGGVAATTLLRAATRGLLAVADAGTVAAGPVLLSVRERTVWWEGVEVQLTPRQFALVQLLVTHPGRVFSRVEMWEACWGLSDYPQSNAIDAHVRRIRRKLPAGLARSIRTAYGVGYRFFPYQAGSGTGELGEEEAVLPHHLAQLRG